MKTARDLIRQCDEATTVKDGSFGPTIWMDDLAMGISIHFSDSGMYVSPTSGSHGMKSFPMPKGDREAQKAIAQKVANEVKGALVEFEKTIMKTMDVLTREYK